METTIETAPADYYEKFSANEENTVASALAGAVISGLVVAGSYVVVRGVVRGWARHQIRRENRRAKKEN